MSARLSLEVFPPRDAAGRQAFRRALAALAPVPAAFCSVTYGAGGSNRRGTDAAVRRLAARGPFEPAGHLTCVGESRAATDRVARGWAAAGVRRIVALRGDRPADGGPFAPHPSGYRGVPELIAGLREIADFDVSVACYPEAHPESTSRRADLEHLRRKLEAGATRAISQYFFDAGTFLRFRERARRAGIEHELVPGVLPVFDLERVADFSRRCGATVPGWVVDRFAGLERDEAARVAVETAAELCRELIAEGVEHIHLYTLNRADLALGVARELGLAPSLELAA